MGPPMRRVDPTVSTKRTTLGTKGLMVDDASLTFLLVAVSDELFFVFVFPHLFPPLFRHTAHIYSPLAVTACIHRK